MCRRPPQSRQTRGGRWVFPPTGNRLPDVDGAGDASLEGDESGPMGHGGFGEVPVRPAWLSRKRADGRLRYAPARRCTVLATHNVGPAAYGGR